MLTSTRCKLGTLKKKKPCRNVQYDLTNVILNGVPVVAQWVKNLT